MKVVLKFLCLIFYLAISSSLYSSLNKSFLMLLTLDSLHNNLIIAESIDLPYTFWSSLEQPEGSFKFLTQSIENEAVRGMSTQKNKLQIKKNRRKQNNLLLNLLNNDFRRKLASDSSSSSSREVKKFKTEFDELWAQKKYEAIHSLDNDIGDRVNMAAARPWGVPCGDPNQHDVPWGSCTLDKECDGEYRIYRGDFFCGRSRFVCCSIMLTNYDMYEGFDVSFDSASLSTDSEERKRKRKTSKERRKQKQRRDKKKRQKRRKTRKRRLRKMIKKIQREMKSLLQKQYRNGTKERERRTRQLKTFIKKLMKQYKKDKQSIYSLHDKDMLAIDKTLGEKLQELLNINKKFVSNQTFRDVVVNGSYNPQAARMLWNVFKQQAGAMKTRRGLWARRAPRYIEYDIEYGYLYS